MPEVEYTGQTNKRVLLIDLAGVSDYRFLCLFLAGAAGWLIRRHSSLRLSSVPRVFGLAMGGIAFLIGLQVTNNALFDRFFPEATTMHAPEGLDPR